MKKILAGLFIGVALAVGFAALAIVGPINSVTRLLVGSGTVTVPAITFIAEPNTGFFRGAASAIDVGVLGANTHRLQTNGFWMKDNASAIFSARRPMFI
jgi:hypothetical protein